MKMIQIAYISTETFPLENSEIKNILSLSTINNASKGISGMLIYYNHTFLQVLEGNENLVLSLYEKIKLDKRHKNLLILYQTDILSPDFSSWSMGFVDVEEIVKQGDKDFITYFKTTFANNEESISQENIEKVKLLIYKFKKGAWRNYIKL